MLYTLQSSEVLRCRLYTIRQQLHRLAEPEYAKFQSNLLRKPNETVPTGSAARLLGVRLPALRRLAGQLAKEDWQKSLNALTIGNRTTQGRTAAASDAEQINHTPVFEEILLEGILIGLADRQGLLLEEQFSLVCDYVPLIDNWALCDSFCAGLKAAEKYPDETWEFLQPFLHSGQEYAIRFGVVMLLDYFIKETYIDRLYPIFDGIRHDAYYVKMAVAWAISICYVKFPVKTLEYLENCSLDAFTWKKALQKIVESRCISLDEKERIRRMRDSKRS